MKYKWLKIDWTTFATTKHWLGGVALFAYIWRGATHDWFWVREDD